MNKIQIKKCYPYNLYGALIHKLLFIPWNRFSDITPLKNLVNLEILDLSINQISDISSLRNLANLRELDLYNNQVTDISPLKNLVNLKKNVFKIKSN
jgi:hypothetical protein